MKTSFSDDPKKLSRFEQDALVHYVICATHHGLDDPEEAVNIVEFWKRGTASSAETAIIETYLKIDQKLKNRFRIMFPALTNALKSAGYS